MYKLRIIKNLILKNSYIDVLTIMFFIVSIKEKDGHIHSKVNKYNPFVLLLILIVSLIKTIKNELSSSDFDYSEDVFLTNTFNNITYEQYVANQEEEIKKRFM